MNKAKEARRERLYTNRIPKYVRCYDNGSESIDQYTVVFTGNFISRKRHCWYLSMSTTPFHPQGFAQYGWRERPIDRPTYGHLGKKIKFEDLPEDCQTLIRRDYEEIWGL